MHLSRSKPKEKRKIIPLSLIYWAARPHLGHEKRRRARLLLDLSSNSSDIAALKAITMWAARARDKLKASWSSCSVEWSIRDAFTIGCVWSSASMVVYFTFRLNEVKYQSLRLKAADYAEHQPPFSLNLITNTKKNTGTVTAYRLVIVCIGFCIKWLERQTNSGNPRLRMRYASRSSCQPEMDSTASEWSYKTVTIVSSIAFAPPLAWLCKSLCDGIDLFSAGEWREAFASWFEMVARNHESTQDQKHSIACTNHHMAQSSHNSILFFTNAACMLLFSYNRAFCLRHMK